MANIIFLQQNKLGDTPLHSAAWKGHADIVQLLLDQGITNILDHHLSLAFLCISVFTCIVSCDWLLLTCRCKNQHKK